jgi:hypothetical protein
MRRNLLLTALFMMTLLIAPGAYGDSITLADVDLTISPTVNLSDVYLVEGYTPSFGFANTLTVYSLGSLSGGASRTFSDVPDSIYSGTGLLGGPTVNYFTIVGLYDVPNGLVTIGFRDSIASMFSAENAGFEVPVHFVSNFGLPSFSGTEAALATALETGDTATIGSLLATLVNQSYSGPGLGTVAAPIIIGPGGVTGSLTLDNFSNAAFGGTASLTSATTATPEPGSVGLLGTGLLLVSFKRRRFRAAKRHASGADTE